MSTPQTNEAAAAEKKFAPPLISSSAGAKEGDAGVGITLFVNADKTKENSPELTGYYQQNGKRHYVAGWLVKAGKTADGKEYGAFVSLRETERVNGEYKAVGQGTLSGVNNWKGAPVDDTHRSRAIANLTVNGAEVVATGFATEELARQPEYAAALGFTGPIVAETPEADPAPEAKKGPKP